MALPLLTRQQVIEELDSGYRWYTNSITYSFALSTAAIYSANEEAAGFTPLKEGGKSAAKLIFQLWDDLIAPSLRETPSGASYTSADVELGGSFPMDAYASTYYPRVGSVWFNLSNNTGTSDLANPKIGDHGFGSYIHEIGHALGLDHMGDYNGKRDSGPKSFQDSNYYTVMSYFGPGWGEGISNGEGLVAWADWKGSDGRVYEPQTPMVHDILAVQKIYGADNTTRTNNTIYGFNSNVDGQVRQVFDFALNKNPIITIYDAGGVDTLDSSGWSTPVVIDLAPGAYSSGNNMTDNIAIAYGTYIENAVGGSSSNKISGNELNNRLVGGPKDDIIYGLSGDDQIIINGGNDFVDGGSGFDTAVFFGKFVDHMFTPRSTELLVDYLGGKVSLRAIEAIEFKDYIISVNELFYNNKTFDLKSSQNFSKATPQQIDSVIELYTAYFGRIPEVSGLKYWTDQLVSGKTLNEISKAFFAAGLQYSQQTGYSNSMTNSDFVKVVYSNVLGRTGSTAPSSQEVNFWASQLNSGIISKEVLIQDMLVAARTYVNDPQWGWVTNLLDNKISVGRTHSIDFGINYNSPEDAITRTVAITQAVNPTNFDDALKLIGIMNNQNSEFS